MRSRAPKAMLEFGRGAACLVMGSERSCYRYGEEVRDSESGISSLCG